MSALYDQEMLRRLMAPPEGSEPPGVAKGSRQQAVAQPKRMPPPPQAAASYGGQEQLPPLPPLIQQAMAGERAQRQDMQQLFRDTAPGISPAETRLLEMSRALPPIGMIRGTEHGYMDPNANGFVAGSPPDYKYLADSARYAREEGAKQDQRNAGLMAGRNTPAAMQSLAQVESAKIAAESPKDVTRMADLAFTNGYNAQLALRPNDPDGAAAAGKLAREAVLRNAGVMPPVPSGGPPPAPSGEFQPPPGMPAAPPAASNPGAVTTAMSTYNVIPKAATPGASVASDLNAKAMADMLMAEGGLRNQYPELARQALTSGIPEGNVTLPTVRQIIAYHNAATRDAPEGTYGPYTIKRTATPFTPAEMYQGEQTAGHGGATTGYTVTGPGMEGGMWNSRGATFWDPLSGPWFATDKTRAEAGEKASLLANVLQQMMVQKAKMAPPPNAAPPK